MSIRKIKDARDLSTNELIYFKGHAKATFMSDGKTVEEAINQIGIGSGGITVETDPIFSASPAASITDAKKAEWDGKYAKPSGGIPNSDLSEELREKLETAHRNAMAYQGTVTNIKINGVTKSANNGVVDLGNLGTYSKPSTGIPKSDLNPSIQTSLGKADTAVQPEDIKDEMYITDFDALSLDLLAGNHISSLEFNKQGLKDALGEHKVILVPYEISDNVTIKGYCTLVGFYEDLLYIKVITEYSEFIVETALNTQYILNQEITKRNWYDKQDALVSGENIKTINGESILGSGDITIGGGVGTITGVSANGTSIATSGVADIPAASTSKYGVTKLTTLTNSSSTTLAATASAVKVTYDLANSKQDKLESGTNIKTINGESILGSGNITINGGGSSGGGGVETISLSGGLGRALIIEEMLAEKRYWLYVDSGIDGDDQSIDILGFEGDGVKDGAHIRCFYAVIECASPMGVTFNVSLSLPDVEIRWSTGTPIPIRGDGRYELSITQVIESGYAYYNGVLTSFS